MSRSARIGTSLDIDDGATAAPAAYDVQALRQREFPWADTSTWLDHASIGPLPERTRLTLNMTREAMEAERPLMIFPAGKLARRGPDGSLSDPEWMPTAISLARRYEATVIPVHVTGPWSTLFHAFDGVSQELRDITLFHELLNKHGKTYHLTFGPLIPADQVAGDATVVTRKIKHYVERVLGEHPDAAYDPNGPECQWRDPPKPPAQQAR